MNVGDTSHSLTVETELSDREAYNLARALGVDQLLAASECLLHPLPVSSPSSRRAKAEHHDRNTSKEH